MIDHDTPVSFRGEFTSLERLLRDSWGHNRSQLPIYGEPFLRSAFLYPDASFDLAPTIYIDDQPAAFVAGFPRRVQLDDREMRLALVSLWATASRFHGRGYGSRVWMEVLRRGKAAGYDGAVNFFLDGAPSNSAVLACGERVGAKVRRVFSVRYLARLLRPGPVLATADTAGSIDHFLRAATQVPASVSLRRMWSRAEAEWQCLQRPGAVQAVHADGQRCGALTGCVVSVVDSEPAKVMLIDDILWADLLPSERSMLLEGLLAQGAASGARMAVVPLMGYAETSTFKDAGFRQSRRVMNMYVTSWTSFNPEPVPTAYLDVF
ncbi:MAG: hypothetical protein JO134_01035 [Xanthobacteraceae bacterium]|nr:hypothetical protein [Xanthobacteraceae bacterium]